MEKTRQPHYAKLESGKTAWLDWFTYTFPVVSNLAILVGNTTVQITIQADSDFEWVESAYEYDLAAAAYVYNTRPMPNSTVLITDTGSGRVLMNAAVPVVSIFGRPEMPYRLPISKVFKAKTTINALVTNFDAAVANGNLRLSMIGWKIFYD